MENLFILYITCFIIFYFSGRAVFVVVEKATKKKTDYLFDLKRELYILLGIIYYRVSFISNFFFSLNQLILVYFWQLCSWLIYQNFQKLHNINIFS